MGEEDGRKACEKAQDLMPEEDGRKAREEAAQDLVPEEQAWGPAEREQASREWDAMLARVAQAASEVWRAERCAARDPGATCARRAQEGRGRGSHTRSPVCSIHTYLPTYIHMMHTCMHACMHARLAQGGRVSLRGSVASRREMSKRLVFFTVAERSEPACLGSADQARPHTHGSLPQKSGAADVEGRGAQRRRQIEVLCDLSRWQGEGDFYVETKLVRTDTEVELEGFCSISEKRGEPRIPPRPALFACFPTPAHLRAAHSLSSPPSLFHPVLRGQPVPSLSWRETGCERAVDPVFPRPLDLWLYVHAQTRTEIVCACLFSPP